LISSSHTLSLSLTLTHAQAKALKTKASISRIGTRNFWKKRNNLDLTWRIYMRHFLVHLRHYSWDRKFLKEKDQSIRDITHLYATLSHPSMTSLVGTSRPDLYVTWRIYMRHCLIHQWDDLWGEIVFSKRKADLFSRWLIDMRLCLIHVK